MRQLKDCFTEKIVKDGIQIVGEIPNMLPDDLRNKEEDLQFLKKYKDSLLEEIIVRKLRLYNFL